MCYAGTRLKLSFLLGVLKKAAGLQGTDAAGSGTPGFGAIPNPPISRQNCNASL